MNEEQPSQGNESFYDEPDTIGQRIKYYRLKKGYTARQLSRLTGLRSESAVSQLERGVSAPSIWTAMKLAKTLEVSLDTLVYGSIDRSPVPEGIPTPIARFVSDPKNWPYTRAVMQYLGSIRNSKDASTLLRRLDSVADRTDL